MKIGRSHTILIVGLLVFLFAAGLVARSRATGLMLPGFGTPRIEVETTHIDAGVIPNDEPTTIELIVRNTGRRPLTIHSLSSPCRFCIDLSIDQSTIARDGSATLTVQIIPAAIPTFDYSTFISIVSNDPKQGRLMLPLECTVEPEFTVTPDKLDFGDIPPDRTTEKTLILHQVGEVPVVIQRIHVNPPYPEGLDFQYGPIPQDEWRDPAVPEHYVTARIHPDMAMEQLDTYFRIMTNIGRLQQGIPIRLTANVRSPSEQPGSR